MKNFRLRFFPIFILGGAMSAAESGPAFAQEMVAIKPGVMCVSPEALATLTLPDGSSRTASATASPKDLAAKRDGHCVDIQIGMRVTIKAMHKNTSIVGATTADGHAQTFIVPNIDFQPSQNAPSSGSEVNEYVNAPGGETTYCIKTLPGKTPSSDPKMVIEATYDQNTKSNVLLTSWSSNDPKGTLVGFKNLFLSPDSKTLYFQTDAWATSDAVHAIEIATKRQRFVAPGEIACVVLAGQYQGDLVIQQHRYFVQGGSYDNLWLYDPSGKEIGLVSQDTDSKAVCPTPGN